MSQHLNLLYDLGHKYGFHFESMESFDKFKLEDFDVAEFEKILTFISTILERSDLDYDRDSKLQQMNHISNQLDRLDHHIALVEKLGVEIENEIEFAREWIFDFDWVIFFRITKLFF